MFTDLKSYIEGSAPLEACKDGKPTGRDMQLAVTAVLLQLVKADQRFGHNELETLFSSLSSELDIAESAISELFEIAEFLIKEDQNRLQQYIEQINKNFSTEQRMRVVGLAWKICLADGDLASEETELLTLLRKDLGLTPEQALSAQQRALAGEFNLKADQVDESD